MNYGKFIGDRYVKRVTFSKAVLWHSRQLSLREDIMDRIKAEKVKKIVFIDDLKREKWTFRPEKVFEKMVLKREGQESQYYFPIDLAKKNKMAEPKQPEVKVLPKVVFDDATGTCHEIYPEE